MLRSIAESVCSGSWRILSKYLMLNVTICIALLNFCTFCFSLSSVADFSDTWAQQDVPKSDAVWISGLSMSHDNLSMAVFLFSFIEATRIDLQQ